MFHEVQIFVKFVNQAQASNANISAGDFFGSCTFAAKICTLCFHYVH